jgi:serine/threonine protein kinase
MGESHITLNDHYKLGDILGKGGWGTVYKAWDMHSNTFVAVKEVGLAQIPREMLGGIQSEITLLQSLDHPRIVRYIDSLRSEKALYIVLEYVENGSLEWIVKKFGNFPEHLIAKYIQQVLEGLLYLHGQGVIHRDIKAANILTTKMGEIKLADFGVATKRGGSNTEEEQPAGSPYWMAPEIIEMHGATTTSDIWSVGCTIIELVTGNPPYFELDAMPALFRIVQDDCPPIPDNISPLLRDFLLKCFQKEPLLRSSAEMLLKHRWLTTNIKKAAKPELMSKPSSAVIPQAQVEDWNKKMEAKREEMKKAGPSEGKPSKRPRKQSKAPQPAATLESSSSSDDGDDYGATFDIKSFQFPGSTSKATDSSNAAATVSSPGSLKAPDTGSTTSNASNTASTAKSTTAAQKTDDDEEDWDDMSFEPVKPLTLPKATAAPAKTTKATTAKVATASAGDDDDWDDMAFDSPKKPLTLPVAAANTTSKRTGGTLKKSTPRKTAEGDDDNWDDLGAADGKGGLGGSLTSGIGGSSSSNASSGVSGGAAMELASKLAMKMKSAWDGGDNREDVDPFDVFDDEESSDMDMNDDVVMEKAQAAHIATSAIRSIEGLNSFATEETILAHCDGIRTVFKDYPNEKSHIIARTGVIPFVEMLQMPNPKIVHAILKIINIIVEDSAIRESFSVMGGIASTLQYANRKFSRPIRQETSVFIKQMLSAGRKTMQMFIGARGLPVLVDFIAYDEDYVQNKDLYLIGIDCIYSILTSNLQVRIPKNDFCRLFAKLSLLPHLARAFELVLKDSSARAMYADKIADIFVIFSKGDIVVKTHFCEQDVLKRLFNVLLDLPAPIFLKILKCISALSMSSSTLDHLSTAGAIKILVPFMGRRDGQLMMETLQQLFSALYNLCRLNPGRQLVAAKAGIIPHLQWVVNENHPLKQFALPILFEMARVKKIRDMMKPKEGVLFFLELLKQQYPWQVQAMDCLSIWIGDDESVASTIISNIDPVIDVFKTAITDEVFSRLFEHLHSMISQSDTLNVALSASPILDTVIERTNHKNAIVRVQTLKILESFFVAHPKPSQLVALLQDTITRLQSDSTILVRNLAMKLESKFRKASKGGSRKDTQRGTKGSSAMAAALASASSSGSDKPEKPEKTDRSTSRKHLGSHSVSSSSSKDHHDKDSGHKDKKEKEKSKK